MPCQGPVSFGQKYPNLRFLLTFYHRLYI